MLPFTVYSRSKNHSINCWQIIHTNSLNIRCPGCLANHSQLKSNGANMKPTMIEMFQNGSKIVVFRNTRDSLPLETLRFDYNDPMANKLFQDWKIPSQYLTDGIVRTLNFQSNHFLLLCIQLFTTFVSISLAILYINTDCYRLKGFSVITKQSTVYKTFSEPLQRLLHRNLDEGLIENKKIDFYSSFGL